MKREIKVDQTNRMVTQRRWLGLLSAASGSVLTLGCAMIALLCHVGSLRWSEGDCAMPSRC